MAKDDELSLKEAAARLEAELDSFEALSASVRKMPLGSRKNLERAARALSEAAGYEERIGASLRGLLSAINAAGRRQEESAASIVARGKEIEARGKEYEEVLESYARIGDEAVELTALAREIVAAKGEGGGERLEDLLGRMASLGERLSDLGRTAAAKEMEDIGRDADALKQQIAAARNKLLLLRRKQSN